MEPLGALISSVGLPAAIVVYLLWAKRKDDEARLAHIRHLEQKVEYNATYMAQILASNERTIKALLKVFRMKIRRIEGVGTCIEVDQNAAVEAAPRPPTIIPQTPLPVTPTNLQPVFDNDESKSSTRILVPTKDPSEVETVKLYRRPPTPTTPVATERP